MGESKRRKEFQAKNLVVLPGGEEPIRQPVRRYRTLILEVPEEVWNLSQKLFDVAHDLTSDAPRTKEAWWNLLIGKGCMVIDSHIAQLVEQKLRQQIEEEKGKPTIERVGPSNEDMLATVREILANADSDRDSGPDRVGEGRDSEASSGEVRVRGGEVQSEPQGRSDEELPQDPERDQRDPDGGEA